MGGEGERSFCTSCGLTKLSHLRPLCWVVEGGEEPVILSALKTAYMMSWLVLAHEGSHARHYLSFHFRFPPENPPPSAAHVHCSLHPEWVLAPTDVSDSHRSHHYPAGEGGVWHHQ